MSSKQELLGHLSLICRLSFTHPCTGLKLKSICYKIHRVEERSADLGVFACVTAPLLDGRSITAMQTSCLWSGLCICISVCMCLCGSFPRLPSITSDLRPPVQTGSFFFLNPLCWYMECMFQYVHWILNASFPPKIWTACELEFSSQFMCWLWHNAFIHNACFASKATTYEA